MCCPWGWGRTEASGYPLVGVYLTGKELRAVLEVDASVTPIMPEAQLYLSGIAYSFNTHRMFFNRVTQGRAAGSRLCRGERRPGPDRGRPPVPGGDGDVFRPDAGHCKGKILWPAEHPAQR